MEKIRWAARMGGLRGLVGLGLLAVALCGCGRKVSSDVLPAAYDLMPLVFPAWTPQGQNVQKSPDGGFALQGIVPVYVVRVAAQRVVLLTLGKGCPAGKDCDTRLGAYWFDFQNGGWKLAKRADCATDAKNENCAVEYIDKIQLLETYPKHYAVAIVTVVDAGTGVYYKYLDAYQVYADSVVNLTRHQAPWTEYGSQQGGGSTCDELFRKYRPGRHLVTTIESYPECIQEYSAWHLVPGRNAPGDIVLDQTRQNFWPEELQEIEPESGVGDSTYRLALHVTKRQAHYALHYSPGKNEYVLHGKPLPQKDLPI